MQETWGHVPINAIIGKLDSIRGNMAREPGVPVSHKAVTASSGHSGGSFRTVRLAALNLRAGHLRLSSEWFAERIHRNRRVLDVDDLGMLRLRWRAQVHTLAGARLHQRIGKRRAPADVAAIEVHLVNADDRDDVFKAGGVLVGHGCAEEDARSG